MPETGREIARGAVQLLMARTVFLASGLVVSVILARGLGPAEFRHLWHDRLGADLDPAAP